MNVIILCGGLSTRLGDITKNIPKILLTIGDRTVLDWQLEHVRKLGATDVILAAGHLSDVLKEAVGSERLGMRIIHAVEPKRLGTGGAIKFAWQYLIRPEEPVLVLNGDVLTTVPMVQLRDALQSDSEGIILGTYVDDASSLGTLLFDGKHRLTSFKEKEGLVQPGIINGGVYLFTQAVRQYFPDTDVFSMEYDVFPHMKRLYVFPSHDAWIDVGVPERLAWAREHWQTFLHHLQL